MLVAKGALYREGRTRGRESSLRTCSRDVSAAVTGIAAMNAEQRIQELKLELPPAPKPVAVYKPVVVVDRMAYVSGHGPLKPDKTLLTGHLGADLSIEQGKTAARQVGLAIIATLKDQGLLANVRRVVKVLGMVNSTEAFRDHPA